MFKEIPNGTLIEIPDNAFGYVFKCWIPPIGYGVSSKSGKVLKTEIIKRSDIPEEQYWDRPTLPRDFKERRAKEKARQKIDKEYVDPYLEDIRKREWKRRIRGVWFWNYNPYKKESECLYMTGLQYLYNTYWKFQGKYMDFRIPDMHLFYVVEYCMEDPDCLGLNELTKRKNGKTARVGCWAYERTSRMANHHGGLQSKSDTDAAQAFKKAVVQPWGKLPDFFRPRYDLMKGEDPSELRFFPTARRGEKINEEDNENEEPLESFMDFMPSTESAYDGPELHTYVSDEAGKCFGEGTEIRMYDGNVKMVEDIVEGDVVMGDDSTGRNVFGVTSGKEMMYRVIPKKGYSWECNESHILSLKWCMGRDNKARGWKAKSIINISVKDYLGLKIGEKNHLMLYKNPVEYSENRHLIDPYFFGLWLGDGSKKTVEITTNDTEVVDYIKSFAERHRLYISKSEAIRYYLGGRPKTKVWGEIDGVYHEFKSKMDANRHLGYHEDTKLNQSTLFIKNGLSIQEPSINYVLKELNRLNVTNNKHIPKEYLIDSRNNRLELLAGLVDSDGHIQKGSKNKLPKGIEITQKLKRLAYEIQELCISLGFYASLNKKIAKMKRADKSVYECEVYRVNIYGDLWQIPTKVQRKQVPKIDFHVNRRTSAHSGFKIESMGVGDYYGFAVDGNSLFLLKDGTVVHNTKKPVSIKERQNVVRFCTEIDGVMMGKHWYTTTVEVEKGEEENYEFQEMTANSNPLDRDENNRTGTGLYTYFLPAPKGMMFDDKYGYPNEGRAVTFLSNTIKSYEAKNDLRGLSSFKRKNPQTFKEAFSTDGEFALYNPELLNRQLDNISWNKKFTEFGDLEWKDGYRVKRPINLSNGEVEYEPNEVEWVSNPKGKFERVVGWQPREQNKVFWEGQSYAPNNNNYLSIGCDPFKYDKTKDKRRSNCAAFAYQIPDPTHPDPFFDNMFTLRYAFREESTRAANEDVLKMAWWCGCKVLFERNVNHWKNDFVDWECSKFLKWMPRELEPGIITAAEDVQTICNYTEAYINEFIHKVYFKTLIRKDVGWLGFKVEETEKFDEPMAAGITLIDVKGKIFKNKGRTYSIYDYFPKRKMA